MIITWEKTYTFTLQYLVNMHFPEHWGYVQFSDHPAGHPSAFSPDPAWPLRAFLAQVYYAQQLHWQQHSAYARTLHALRLKGPPPEAHVQRLWIEPTRVRV